MERPPSRLGWTWLLIALSAVVLALIVSEAVNLFDGELRFWEVGRFWNGEPFVLVAGEPRPGGAAARAGIRISDRIDLRDQTPAMRRMLYVGPRGAASTDLIVRREGRPIKLPFVGGTVWDGATLTKMLTIVVALVGGICFLGCALLIIARRASLVEARWLALTLLCIALGATWTSPDGGPLLVVLFSLPIIPLALLVGLSARFGPRSAWRTAAQWATYAAVAAAIAMGAIGWYGWMTARIDPMPLYGGYSWASIAPDYAAAFFALIAVIGAVATTDKSERARAGWLLLPLTISLCIDIASVFLVNYAPSWVAYASIELLSSAFVFLGALFVTYALLRRRVIDVGFVVSRTIVVAIVSLVVVAAFVLLEWLLGTVLADASHATGLFANAALALVLGLSMRYIHKRVDLFVDSVMFRKRHDDERALRAFAKEATFVTDTDALFDLTIANVRAHTNATGAAILMNGDGAYRNVRGFGTVPSSASENDPAVLALKAWHNPIDPHRYETALAGDLALPIVARGHLHGVLLFEQRESGEAYAPDEIDALAAFAHGIGSAYDTLVGRAAESNATVEAISALLDRRFGPLE
jgi:hypothetical protein